MIIFDYITHIISVLFIGYGLNLIIGLTSIEMCLYYFFLIIGVLLPDIDTPKSFLGSKIKPLSNLIFNIFGHRGITHNILFICGVFLLSLVIYGGNVINISIFIGCIVHVLGDLLQKNFKLN